MLDQHTGVDPEAEPILAGSTLYLVKIWTTGWWWRRRSAANDGRAFGFRWLVWLCQAFHTEGGSEQTDGFANNSVTRSHRPRVASKRENSRSGWRSADIP